MTPVTRHYEDFVLRIESAGGGQHRVRAKSEQGNGSTDFILPSALVEACAGISLVPGEPADDRRQLAPAVLRRPHHTRRELAGALFEALFRGRVRSLYEGSRAASPLRIRIAVDPRETALARLPWEILYDVDRGEFLGLNRRSLVVRHLDVLEPAEIPLPSSRLRILAVASSPRDTVELDLEQEMRHLRELSEREVFDLEILGRPTLHGLRQELQRSDADVLHFMGHGELDSRTGRGELVFETPGGLSERIPGEALATTLRDLTSLRLVVLNACRTATMPRGGEAFAGVAPALVQAGLSAVVAMQRPISDPAAIAFSGTFYRRLAAGDSIEQAVVEGRHAIHAADHEGMEWAIPVLFSRKPQGRPVQPSSSGKPEEGATEPPVAARSSLPTLLRHKVLMAIIVSGVVLALLWMTTRSFRDTDDGQPVSGPGGEVGIYLVEENGERPVDVDHEFHTGDFIRFIVLPNHNGWLYIYHRQLEDGGQQSGQLRLLWPASGAPPQGLTAGQEVVYPPWPKALRFDETTGRETFYFAVCRQPENCVAIDGETTDGLDLQEFELMTERNVLEDVPPWYETPVSRHGFTAAGNSAVISVVLRHEQ